MKTIALKALAAAPRTIRAKLSAWRFAAVNRLVIEQAVAGCAVRHRGWPQEVTLNLCNVCNMRCRICNISDLERRSEFVRNQLSPEVFAGLSDLFLGATTVDFNGFIGESLLNPDVLDIARWFKARGARLFVSTNGLALTPSVCAGLVEMGFDHVNFSLHGGTEKTYRYLQSPQFDKVLGNVRHLLSLRRQAGAAKPIVVIVHAMNKANIGELRHTLDLAGDLGVDRLEVYHYRDYGFNEIALDTDPAPANAAIDDLYAYAAERRLLGMMPARRPYYRVETQVPDDATDAAPEVRCELPWRGLQLIGSCVHAHSYYLGVCSMFRIMRLDYEEHLRAYGKVRVDVLLNHPVLRFLRHTVNSRPGLPRNPLCRFCRSRWRDYLKNTDTVKSGEVKNRRLREFFKQFQAAGGTLPTIRGVTVLEQEDPEFLVMRE